MKRFLQTLIVALSLFATSIALAQNGPKETLQVSIDGLLVQFAANRTELETDKVKLYSFAEKVIDENWDFAKMAQLVLGKNWRRIDDEQKTRFIAAFKGLLVRTYSTAMFQYTGNETIDLQEPIYKKSNRAVVNADGSLGDGSGPIALSFSMFKDKDLSWRIYNVAVAGVSLVTTYRSSYNQIISAKGIDFLIDSISKKTS